MDTEIGQTEEASAPETIKCIYCGADVKIARHGIKRYACARCMHRKTSRYALRMRQVARGTVRESDVKELVENDMIEFGRRVHKDPKAFAAKAKKELPKDAERCKFCGGIWQVRGGYCYTCRLEGLDKVHAVTGRSNGWERKIAKPVKVVGGWRGQKCAGGRAASYKVLHSPNY